MYWSLKNSNGVGNTFSNVHDVSAGLKQLNISPVVPRDPFIHQTINYRSVDFVVLVANRKRWYRMIL